MSKKLLPVILVVLLLAVLIFGYIEKNNLNSFISDKIQEQSVNSISVEQSIQKRFNYLQNEMDYDFTFLEFSSTGCTICKQMEPVLEEIRNSGKVKVNVVFLHIMKSENLDLMKYYGISAVPMQILLDKQGKEFFRHYGFISSDELYQKFN